MQQKKAAREVQALLDTQWNAEYSAAEVAWRIERDQARTEHRKPPEKPLKSLRPRVVDMGVQRVWRVQGVWGVWRMWRVKRVKRVKRVRRIWRPQRIKEELADVIPELNIAKFCNIRACK